MTECAEHEGLPLSSADPAADLARAALSLARRFAAGATMWCVCPEWPHHGRHVAVEFVHPVIVGKRALPTVSLDADRAVVALRRLARPGDLLLAVGRAGDPVVSDLVLRSEAWGLSSVWLGAGPRPSGRSADHMVWLSDVGPEESTRSGDLVLLYHLLWELTHVVLEHRGLLFEDVACTDEVCITCSDEGRVTEVTHVIGDNLVGVLAAGQPETVDASLVTPVQPGDLLLVHAGVALTTLTAGAQ